MRHSHLSCFGLLPCRLFLILVISLSLLIRQVFSYNHVFEEVDKCLLFESISLSWSKMSGETPEVREFSMSPMRMNAKMTRETPEVRSDKRKQRKDRGEKEKREKERKGEKGEKRREKERKKRENKRKRDKR